MRLRYIPYAELARLRALDDPFERARAIADACRVNVLYMVMRSGSGHLGTSFSSLDLLTWLHLEELRDGDRCFSSKGHDAPAVYAVLAALGKIDFELIHRLRRLGGLAGHPDVQSLPPMLTNTGSLGMGVSKARGFVLADRHAGRDGRVFVLTGDGELQEGQFWESLQPTSNRGLSEITVIVDHNKLQSDTWVEAVSDLGNLEAKVGAFGWATARCDGNDVVAIAQALDAVRDDPRPRLLVADTRKGAGVSFMEPHTLPRSDVSLYDFHSGAPSAEDYERALAELLDRLSSYELQFEEQELPERSQPSQPQRLVSAYGAALVAQAEREPSLVALDGDLRLDTGLVPFQARFPDRFFECGIAEQDMVSQAGAMALGGLLPVVHSFACFLTPRANEQIFNNASEGTKVIYVGSLAGLVPGGPGHSHQSVRDIALMGSVPGMSALEPYCEAEARAILRWAVEEATGPVYLRLVSVPWELPFDPPDVQLEPGRGTLLRQGGSGSFVTTGPVLVAQAWLAAEELDFSVIALPWLTDVDGAWLAEIARDEPVFCLDNHYITGGQGDALLAAGVHCVKVGVETVPVCGTNDEVLRAHGLDAAGIVEAVRRRASIPA